MKNYTVSIIVPIYNVEKYIAKCATTLFEQDFDSIEYIFANDCTPDNSIQILQNVIEKYPNRKDDIKIINNAQNSGSSLTRKNGLDNASGEYILFIDSDDWVEPDMVSSMYKKAKEDDADIVCCDYFINYKNKVIYQKEKYGKMEDLKALLLGMISPVIWNKLQKKELYKNIIFPNFQFGEDLFIMTQLFYMTKKICYTPRAYMHYNRENEISITATMSEKVKFEFKELYFKILDFLNSNKIYDKYIYYHRMRTVKIAIAYFGEYADTYLKTIDENLVDVGLIWHNKSLSFFKKIGFSIKFLGFNNTYNFLRKIYRKIKYKIEF